MGIFLGHENRFAVLLNLFRRFKVMIVSPQVIILTIVRRVFAADLRPSFIDAATIVGLQVFASRVYQQVPGFILSKNSGLLVQQIPADVVEILDLSRRINRQSKIAATLGRAEIAQDLPRLQIFSTRFFLNHLAWLDHKVSE